MGSERLYEKLHREVQLGVDFDPSCHPAHAEGHDLVVWQTRLEGIEPEMWQIYIEAVASRPLTEDDEKVNLEVNFEMEMAIRGKNREDEEW